MAASTVNPPSFDPTASSRFTSTNSDLSSNAATNSSSISSPTPLRSLFLHTHDVARNLKPSPDGELANALHETLHFALDGEQEDWGVKEDHRIDSGCGGQSSATEINGSSITSTNDQVTIGEDTLLNHSDTTSAPNSNATDNEISGNLSALPKARPGFLRSTNPNRPYISYFWNEQSHTLSLPNPSLISNPTQLDPCSPERRNDFDVTAKLFFLGKPSGENGGDQSGFKEEYIDQALTRLMLTTGLITVDTLILAFPSMKFDKFGNNEELGQDENEQQQNSQTTPCGGEDNLDARDDNQSRQPSHEESEALARNVKHVKKLWEAVSPNPQCISLGLSDFSLPALKALFNSFSPAPPPPPPSSSPTSTSDHQTSNLSDMIRSTESDCNESGSSTIPVVAPPVEENSSSHESSSPFVTPSQTRRPRVVTINVKQDPCSFDRQLSKWCQEQGMQVLSHGDRRDILPEHTLNSLLSEFTSDLPHPLPTDRPLRARWVLKYSVLIESRGVLADRGYIVYADTEE